MSVKVSLERINKAVNFKASDAQGSSILMDGTEELGGIGNGVRPMQTLLMGLAGCSAVDMVMILGKMKQALEDIKIDVDATLRKYDTHKEFDEIHMTFYLVGDIKPAKAIKAVNLSVTKYCSVAKILEKSAEIKSTVYLNGEIIE